MTLRGKDIVLLGIVELVDSRQIQPASVDLTLHCEYLRARKQGQHIMDPTASNVEWDKFICDRAQGWTLARGELMLVSSFEKVNMPRHLVGKVSGKSSLARWGLEVQTAGYVDPGFVGRVTLELLYSGPGGGIRLYSGMPICQLSVSQMAADTQADAYDGKYQGAEGPQASRYSANWWSQNHER